MTTPTENPTSGSNSLTPETDAVYGPGSKLGELPRQLELSRNQLKAENEQQASRIAELEAQVEQWKDNAKDLYDCLQARESYYKNSSYEETSACCQYEALSTPTKTEGEIEG